MFYHLWLTTTWFVVSNGTNKIQNDWLQAPYVHLALHKSLESYKYVSLGIRQVDIYEKVLLARTVTPLR